MPAYVQDRIVHLRGRLGGLRRNREPDDPEMLQIAEEINSLRVERLIYKALSEEPKFNHVQVDELCAAVRACGYPGIDDV